MAGAKADVKTGFWVAIGVAIALFILNVIQFFLLKGLDGGGRKSD